MVSPGWMSRHARAADQATPEPDMSDLLLLASTDAAAKTWFYAGFVVMILFFLALDLGVFNRTSHETTLREALTWTGVWVTTALCFGAGVYFIYEHKWLGIGLDVAQGAGQAARNVGGGEAAGLYLTAWMLEYALSMDNIFVIALIFRYFMVPAIHQHREPGGVADPAGPLPQADAAPGRGDGGIEIDRGCQAPGPDDAPEEGGTDRE